MEPTNNLPRYHEVTYRMNPKTGYYEKQPQRIPFNRLPYELKVEPTQEQKIQQQGANEVIRGRIKEGKYTIFTGIIPADFPGTYWGNDYVFVKGEKKTSLMIFIFEEEDSVLRTLYFPWFYITSRTERVRFVNETLSRVV